MAPEADRPALIEYGSWCIQNDTQMTDYGFYMWQQLEKMREDIRKCIEVIAKINVLLQSHQTDEGATW